jgi:thiosulfate/3-mercaptopyruvate sulfurtransferase
VEPLVSSAWLAAHLGEPELRVADVRWYLDPARKGIDAYRAGHIEGAVFLDVERDLAAPGGRRGGALGRHPWPGPEQVGRVMGAAGIGPTTRVVAYDDQAGAVAARLWYVLRAHGHELVTVLDGGIAKWLAEGRSLSTKQAPVSPAVFVPRLEAGSVLTKAEMLARPRGALVIDARAAERYRGDVEPIDPRPGHIPGAKSAPYTDNLTASPTPVFRSPAELRAHYEALGADAEPPIVYCGSGITACHDLLALARAGLGGRLYGGSWSEWCSDPGLPVTVGSEP